MATIYKNPTCFALHHYSTTLADIHPTSVQRSAFKIPVRDLVEYYHMSHSYPLPMLSMVEQRAPSHMSPFSWDMQSSSIPHFPCFRFLSDRLARYQLHLILILSPSDPLFLNVCPMPKAAEARVIRVCRRACAIFPTTPEWVSQIASRSISRSALDQLAVQPSESYLTRRSLIQHEIIFSGEGLTLLSADHIHTFKKQLSVVSKMRFTDKDYTSQLDSCVHLLRRINNTYRGVKLSRSYLERAYGNDLCHSTLREVCKAYYRNFRQTGVKEVSLEADSEIPLLPELESPITGQPTHLLPELESPTVGQRNCLPLESLTSQICTGIPSALDARTRRAGLAHARRAEILEDELCDIDMGSPCDYLDIRVTYPKVPRLTELPGPPPLSSQTSQSSLDTIITTICSRCLVSMQAEEVTCGQEMQMLLSPEWENFRRIGLGIVRC